jgi:hypothetical protein
MTRWHVFHPDHEFPGQLLIDLANAIGSEDIMPYFEKHGMTNIDPKAWYPMQKLIDIYNEMQEAKSGTMFDFVSIGMKEAEQAIIPPQLQSLPLLSVLQSVGEVFKLNNRGTDPGEIKCEIVADKHVKMILRVTTPDDLWYGILYGYVRRFVPKGGHFTVFYDKDIPRRDEGNDVTIIHITWD